MKKTSVGCGGVLGLRGKFCKDLKVEMVVVNKWFSTLSRIVTEVDIKKKGSCLVSIYNIETYPKVATFCISNNKSLNQQGDYELMNVIDATPISVGPPGNNGIYNQNQMPAEFQLPAPIVQTHSAYFARYCKNHADGIWTTADVSIGSSHPSPLLRFRRRPSGCLIEAMANVYSKVTWVEHVEVDDRFVHQLYKPLINSSLLFEAQRWFGTLGSQYERKASVLASILSSDLAYMGISNQEGGRSMMRLAVSLVRSYNQGVSSTTAHTWTILAGSGADDVRVMSRKSIGEPGKPTGFVLCGDSDYISILPSGISVLPDGTKELAAAAGDDINAAGGSLLNVAFPILVDSDPNVRSNHGGFATINGLITWTVYRIKAYVTESGDNGFAVNANLVHRHAGTDDFMNI